jgi:predicted nucleic-acid-binding protein
MIGIDTNILARYILGDDSKHSPRARTFFRGLTRENPGWIPMASIQELVWLMDRTFKMPKDAILTVLEGLESRNNLVFERAADFSKALYLYRSSSADFGDCLITASAQAAGCSKVVTFDKIAARDLGMELLSS